MSNTTTTTRRPTTTEAENEAAAASVAKAASYFAAAVQLVRLDVLDRAQEMAEGAAAACRWLAIQYPLVDRQAVKLAGDCDALVQGIEAIRAGREQQAARVLRELDEAVG